MPTATSRSNVNSASSSRPLRTNSFPARTTSGSPPFATNAKRLPPSGKYRWCDCIVVHDHALGQPQEPLVERRLLHARPLDEVHDLVELAERVAPRPERVEAGDDVLEANRAVGLDARSAQRCRGSRRREAISTGPGCVWRCPYETLPLGTPSSATSIVASSSLAHEPAHGPREPEARAPRHRLAELQAGDDRREPLGQHLRDRPPGHLEPEEPVAHGQVVDRRAVALREARGGAVAQRLGRSLDPLVGRPLRHARREREAARPDEELVGGSRRGARARGPGSCSPASMHAAAGSSSQPISNSSDGMRLLLFCCCSR